MPCIPGHPHVPSLRQRLCYPCWQDTVPPRTRQAWVFCKNRGTRSWSRRARKIWIVLCCLSTAFSFCINKFPLCSFHRLEGGETEAQRGMVLPGGTTVTKRMSQGPSLPLAPLSSLCSLRTPVSPPPHLLSPIFTRSPNLHPFQAPLLPFCFLQGPSVHPWVAQPRGRAQESHPGAL